MGARKLSSMFKREGDRDGPAPDLPEAAPNAAKPGSTKPAAAPETAAAVDPASAKVADKPAETPASPSSPTPSPAPPTRGSKLVEGPRPSASGSVKPELSTVTSAVAGLASRPSFMPAAAAATVALALGLGFVAGNSAADGSRDGEAARWLEAATSLRASAEEVARVSAEMKALKSSVEALRGDRDKSRGEILAKQGQLAEKLERLGQDQSSRMSKLAEHVDRLEKTQRDPARLQGFSERLDKMEKAQAATAPVSAPPPRPAAAATASEPAQTGSIGEGKPAPDPRKVQLEGFFVRDVDDGYALIETKSGRFLEVAVGSTLPGVGRVEAIERRGRQWVVLTAKGYVGER